MQQGPPFLPPPVQVRTLCYLVCSHSLHLPFLMARYVMQQHNGHRPYQHPQPPQIQQPLHADSYCQPIIQQPPPDFDMRMTFELVEYCISYIRRLRTRTTS